MSVTAHPTVLQVAGGLSHVEGMAIIGQLTCESAGLKDVLVLFDPATFSIVLMASCGCKSHQPLAFAAQLLAQSVIRHGGDGAPCPDGHVH